MSVLLNMLSRLCICDGILIHYLNYCFIYDFALPTSQSWENQATSIIPLTQLLCQCRFIAATSYVRIAGCIRLTCVLYTAERYSWCRLVRIPASESILASMACTCSFQPEVAFAVEQGAESSRLMQSAWSIGVGQSSVLFSLKSGGPARAFEVVIFFF